MPDIAMCGNSACPLRDRCYRYRAVPSPHRQAYGDFKPDTLGRCEYQVPIFPGEHIRMTADVDDHLRSIDEETHDGR